MNRYGKRCVLYPRVSTEMQVDGYSLEGQKNMLTRFADREEMIIVDTYEDAGKSGKSIEGRPAFQKMLRDIEDGLDIDYILVYKLSRFGRNAADILNSLELVQSYGVNLICIEEGIDSSQTSGKLLISVLSAVAEIERENIIEQTMNGRREKARQGGWNGGFAPYGYTLEDNKLMIEETEAVAIRKIFELYTSSEIGLGGIANQLNLQGIRKIPRQNGTLEDWTGHFIKLILDNPVYCGKIAYGRRTKEKVKGTKNDYQMKRNDDYILTEGQHKGIVSEEVWEKAHAKRLRTGVKQPSKIGRDRVHLLSGLLKCPVCGSPMYTNKHAWTNKDGTYKEIYYYVCSRNRMVRGKHCEYKAMLKKTDIEPMVIEAIREIVRNEEYAQAIKKRIGVQIDTKAVDKELEGYQAKLKEVDLNKTRLEREIDSLPADAKYRERKLHDMTLRLDSLYDVIVELEEKIEDARLRRDAIKQQAITLENIYKIMVNFDCVYNIINDEEKRNVVTALIKEIEIYRNDESEYPLKRIGLNFPVFKDGGEVTELLWDKGNTVDTVLVLETINLLKIWSSGLADEDISGSFWNYIFLQYGFKSENSEAAANRLYNYFRGAIKGTLAHYKRFFAPEGTQQYYTSLLLHALAPKQSIESLYSILFDFYVKNLDFQYVTEDISYKVFTKGMRARWDSRIAKNDELQLRADAIFSGLQTLFKERPGYMAVFCDSIVKKMDAILRNENTDLIDPDRNYWDTILVEWYQRKSSTERVQAQGEQRQRKTEYVATTTDRIYAQYTMEHSSVGIAIPKIRLSKVAQQRPVIKIYQSEICIYNAEFSVTGDELCLTTRSLFIPFEEMSYDFSNTPAIRVEIHYDGELLYNSAEKLYRQYILLDASGAERTPHCGTIYLFASNLQEVTFPDDTDGIYSYPYPGQLYRINLDEVSSAAIDGREVFVCASTAAQFRHHTSLRKAVSAQVIHQGVSFDIFPAPFQLFIVLPEGEKSIRYQFSIDGVRHNADAFCDGGNELEIPSENDGLCHCVRIIDLATDLVKYEFNYIVLADFNVTLNAPIYYADGSQATANISFAAKQFHYSLVLEDTSDSIIVPVSGMAWQLELYIPLVHCALMGHNAFKIPGMIWHKSILHDEFVKLELPEGWSGQLMLGISPVPEVSPSYFELGNTLRAITAPQAEYDLWISLENIAGNHINRKITTIACKPTFAAPPIEVIDSTLHWQPEGNYVGDPESTFQVEIQRPGGSIDTYATSTESTALANTSSYALGNYSYQVFLKKKSLFSGGMNELIFKGSYCVGNPLEWLYDGKELIIGDALYWDFETETLKALLMKYGCGILTNLDYQETTIASGETMPAPCYSATLSFISSTGRRIPFNSKPSNDFELVNPAKVWIVNEHLLILRCTTEDAVYVDKDFSTIVNRNPDTYMSKAEQHHRLKTPDYFKYSIREGYQYV